ncbi:MAG: TerB family tellurite resistance protein [Deltaproteobacteria bacterium]|jgi:DnaJ like chaperone protein|nr:TerB family tellurite resistance protein [Deltaproteobacteria bacterium]
MGWLGKMVGGTIGFALGGPLGAIAGAVFGHAFDRSEERAFTQDRQRLSPGEETQFAFFIGAFSMLAKLSQADGRVSQEEVTSIEKFMVFDLNLNRESQAVAMNIFHAAMASPGTFQEFAAQFYQHFRFQPQLLDVMLDILLRVSIADGSLSEAEERLILAAKSIFRIGDTQYIAIKSRYIQDNDRYYTILGADRKDTNEAIRKQYRKLVKEYHPDMIASKGLPEEFTKLAEDKFREIQRAYDMIRKERNIK